MLDGLCRLLQPRHIALIGAREPALAQAMLTAAMQAGATLHIVAERPADALRALRQEGGDRCVLHDAPAGAALSILPVPALCWVDADPNWHTVHGVLAALEVQAVRLGRDYPVTIIEGAGWPHGRRDGYDDPAAVPEAHRHPHERAGLLPGQAMPAAAAGLYTDRYHATAENEPRLGVLTAVEDFMEGRTAALRSIVLPGFGGRVVVTPRAGAGAQAFSADAMVDYLRAIAASLEEVRLHQLIAVAAADAELKQARTVADLLRAECANAAPVAELKQARMMIDLLRAELARKAAAATAEAASQPAAPAAPEPAWRARLRPAVHLARRVVRGGAADDAASDQDGSENEAGQVARLSASPVFDAAWYLQNYADVAEAGLDPALHYLRSGAAELRDPGPFFSTAAYLNAHADVAESGINPLLHYLVSGAPEGRGLGGGFEPAAYLSEHPDVAARGENPLEHFIASQRTDLPRTAP